ncbi:YtpI family protein [Bacillus tianshenii]|nr:YtpI family protein [Bacillus tianshenii]
MPVFGFLSVLAIGFYLFYKTKYFRSRRPMEKQWLSAKSSIALGAFVFLFGLNQIIVWNTTISNVIGILFILIGGMSAFFGFKAKKHYFPLAVDEAEKLNK